MTKTNDEKVWLKKALKGASKKALSENKALNMATLIVRDGKLIRRNWNGEEEIIREIHKPVNVKKKEFRFN